ncbi:UMP kinase [Candidatus Micrarchaeota archaeon CG10_big_fil_rev_8_21_14_0_10_45_29]|nr:MAG: UMP kinase [Candidatus Micrarchaeota archaeon CG10_big_fil_rev_8_21_14_0_10_45_29]
MAETKWVALSVGGSLLNDGKPNAKMASSLAKIFMQTKMRLAIVVGGGKEAREAADAQRKMGKSEFYADMAGIKVTHKNADALRQALGKEAGKKIFSDFEGAAKASHTQKYVIMGGTIPGITTDADACLLAEAIGAKQLVNLSKTAIYSGDPSKNKNAKKFSRLKYSQLISLATKGDKRKAGTHFVFDLLACSLISRSKIKAHFVDGRNSSDVKNAILGKKHNGTVVG